MEYKFGDKELNSSFRGIEYKFLIWGHRINLGTKNRDCSFGANNINALFKEHRVIRDTKYKFGNNELNSSLHKFHVWGHRM